MSTQFGSTGPYLDELVFVEQAGDRIRRALNEVPGRARQAFLLHRLENLPYHRIAEQLHVTTHTVERDVAAVIAHLKRTLFANEGP